MDNTQLVKRYLPERPFPPYAFIPGVNPHPEKEGGHMQGVKLHVSPLKREKPQENRDYLYAIDLFNHGYFWEGHVWWEELWHLAGRKGQLADFLKALIKLAAAGVKEELKQEAPTRGHLERAMELLAPLAQECDTFCGINISDLTSKILDIQSHKKPVRSLKLIIS